MAKKTQSDAIPGEPSGGAAADGAAATSTALSTAADEAIEAVGETLVLRPGPVTPEIDAKQSGIAAQEEASQSPFSVTVGQVYDGPLDLLLDLIRKQNIDIYTFPSR